jgi:glycosyltransferase involved in cell wall biosynthesis
MWLVGYLYNNNGMGTWCWEAAHALADAGESVTLVCSSTVSLPGPTTLPILRIAPAAPARSVSGKILEALGQLSAQGPHVMLEAARQLAEAGTPASFLLLNSTEFYVAEIDAPQLVTAWARGVLFRQYIARLRVHLHGVSHHAVRTILGTIGWWRKDWRTFRRADLVLGVTTPLVDELRAHGVGVELLHPCTHVSADPPIARDAHAPVRLLTAAVSLDDPRKRVLWMLDALRDWTGPNCTLTLVGESSARVRAAAAAITTPVEFTGALSREDVVQTMRTHDVFLFASELDDWGYVVTEAMSQGLAVVAPACSPFDEILGTTGALYAPGNLIAFRQALDDLLSRVDASRHATWERAHELFSRPRFVSRLRSIVLERLPHS